MNERIPSNSILNKHNTKNEHLLPVEFSNYHVNWNSENHWHLRNVYPKDKKASKGTQLFHDVLSKES